MNMIFGQALSRVNASARMRDYTVRPRKITTYKFPSLVLITIKQKEFINVEELTKMELVYEPWTIEIWF